ncbi:MAG: hypothetical protein J3K34DRAFT_201640 [Monoraphidium minutum]|nr:MAG: hypothetical protein J3K34DRAFT_201640 [Monoraphidium minutum]
MLPASTGTHLDIVSLDIGSPAKNVRECACMTVGGRGEGGGRVARLAARYVCSGEGGRGRGRGGVQPWLGTFWWQKGRARGSKCVAGRAGGARPRRRGARRRGAPGWGGAPRARAWRPGDGGGLQRPCARRGAFPARAWTHTGHALAGRGRVGGGF